jgi:2-C-methyl-D-erythritol 4-phosphate cytidylyltransferase
MDAILLAAGRSVRMGGGQGKQLMRIGGRPLIIFSLERLRSHPQIDTIIITCPADRMEDIAKVVKDFSVSDVTLVEGGSTRQESVALALESVKSDRVLVHEAARPMITHQLIDRLLEVDGDAVVPTWEVPFTVAVGDTVMRDEIDRSTLRNIQLPQVFDAAVLREAHTQARAKGQDATEDSMMVFRMGRTVRFVEGSADNLKVTYPVDAYVVHALIFGEGGLR